MAGATLRERALRLLALREHSRSELARKLAAHASEGEVETLLERLVELDLLSDARFAQAYVRSHASRFGVKWLRHELARRGISEPLVDEALASESGTDELERAQAIWQRKYGTAPLDMKEWARQARFLQGRGFSTDVIRKLLKDPHHEPA